MKIKRGWLVNEERRARRDRAFTFTDEDGLELIRLIDQLPNYISPTLQKSQLNLDHIMRLRDKALVATGWMFFKRGKEFLRLQRKDVVVTDQALLMTFHVQKKKKRFKLCPDCGSKNGYRNKFCRECSSNLQQVEVNEQGSEQIVTKSKTLRHKFAGYVTDWVSKFDEMTGNLQNREEALLFPPLRVRFSSAYFDFFSEEPMTVANLDRILQRLDFTMTSSLFRYGGSEKYLRLGYQPYELKEMGDWASSTMPETYATRKGLTPVQRRWSEDTR